MKNLIWCFAFIAFTTLLIQCKADEQNDDIENLLDNPNVQNPAGNPAGGGNNGGNGNGPGNNVLDGIR